MKRLHILIASTVMLCAVSAFAETSANFHPPELVVVDMQKPTSLDLGTNVFLKIEAVDLTMQTATLDYQSQYCYAPNAAFGIFNPDVKHGSDSFSPDRIGGRVKPPDIAFGTAYIPPLIKVQRCYNCATGYMCS